MSFAGVSVIADGKLLGESTAPTIDAGEASGYHLLVLEGDLQMDEGFIRSRKFTVGGHRWYIKYYPNGSSTNNEGFISLHLLLGEETKEKPVKAQFEFSFVHETEKQEPARIQASSVFEFRGYQYHGRERFVRKDTLEKSRHRKDNSFTIRCDVVVATNGTAGASSLITVPPSGMQQNFMDLFLAGQGTDVDFRVSGEMFAAHRCILAARSTVFRALLFGSMKEGVSPTTIVQIDDMDAAVFKAMLGFIYGDSLPALAAQVQNEEVVLLQHLLVAADRYGLLRLRLMCEKKLCEHIDVNTAIAILALAEQHGCDGLKKVCCEFLRCPDNLRAVMVMATDGFDHFLRSSPTLMKDMILAVLPAKRKRE